MCVSALIVLGEKIRSRIDEQTQEHWIISYIGGCRDTDLSFHLKQARNGTNGSLYQPVNSPPHKGSFPPGKGRN